MGLVWEQTYEGPDEEALFFGLLPGWRDEDDITVVATVALSRDLRTVRYDVYAPDEREPIASGVGTVFTYDGAIAEAKELAERAYSEFIADRIGAIDAQMIGWAK